MISWQYLIVLCTVSHVCSRKSTKVICRFEVERVVDGLSHPWGIAFLEGGFLSPKGLGM